MSEPGEGWRVQVGFGLLQHCPMSPERRAAFDKEAERERVQAELEAQQRREAAIERRWELQRQGSRAAQPRGCVRVAGFR